jgi:hypothetical protein
MIVIFKSVVDSEVLLLVTLPEVTIRNDYL